MRKPDTHNFSMTNSYLQPEEQDPLRSIQVSYRKQH